MHTLSRLTGWLILALALASPVAAQTQPAQPPRRRTRPRSSSERAVEPAGQQRAGLARGALRRNPTTPAFRAAKSAC